MQMFIRGKQFITCGVHELGGLGARNPADEDRMLDRYRWVVSLGQ
jgi:hypothetical protein